MFKIKRNKKFGVTTLSIYEDKRLCDVLIKIYELGFDPVQILKEGLERDIKKSDYNFDNDEFFKLLTKNGSEVSKLAESAAEKIDLLTTEVLNAYLHKYRNDE